MGQYYKIAFKRKGDEKPTVSNRLIKGEGYVMARLMKHSWFGCMLPDVVANLLSKGRCRLAWVGDYADGPEEVEKVTRGDLSYSDVWGAAANDSYEFDPVEFDYRGKYLVNHTKWDYIFFDDYIDRLKAMKAEGFKDRLENPIPILTAVGNNRGSGDYDGEWMDAVGSWAWDEISIETSKPEGYTEYPKSIVFISSDTRKRTEKKGAKKPHGKGEGR